MLLNNVKVLEDTFGVEFCYGMELSVPVMDDDKVVGVQCVDAEGKIVEKGWPARAKSTARAGHFVVPIHVRIRDDSRHQGDEDPSPMSCVRLGLPLRCGCAGSSTGKK